MRVELRFAVFAATNANTTSFVSLVGSFAARMADSVKNSFKNQENGY
jgi:hypothetical protein